MSFWSPSHIEQGACPGCFEFERFQPCPFDHRNRVWDCLAQPAPVLAPLDVVNTFTVVFNLTINAHAIAEAAIGFKHGGHSFHPVLVLTFLSTLTRAPVRALSTVRGMSGIMGPFQNSRKKARRSGHDDGDHGGKSLKGKCWRREGDSNPR